MPSFWGISTGLSDFGGTGPQGLWGWDSAQRGGSAQERIENFAESTHNDSEGIETIVVTGHRQEVLLEQLLEIKQWYDELEQEHPVAATVVDVTPIIGDIMGIAEAIQDPSLLNIGIAAAGIVPGLGDAIATATKGAKKLFGRGAEGAKGGQRLLGHTRIGHTVPWGDMTKAQRKAFQHSYSRHADEMGLPKWSQKNAESLRQQFNNVVGHIRETGIHMGARMKPFNGKSTRVNYYESNLQGTRYYYYETMSGQFISAGKAR